MRVARGRSRAVVSVQVGQVGVLMQGMQGGGCWGRGPSLAQCTRGARGVGAWPCRGEVQVAVRHGRGLVCITPGLGVGAGGLCVEMRLRAVCAARADGRGSSTVRTPHRTATRNVQATAKQLPQPPAWVTRWRSACTRQTRTYAAPQAPAPPPPPRNTAQRSAPSSSLCCLSNSSYCAQNATISSCIAPTRSLRPQGRYHPAPPPPPPTHPPAATPAGAPTGGRRGQASRRGPTAGEGIQVGVSAF